MCCAGRCRHECMHACMNACTQHTQRYHSQPAPSQAPHTRASHVHKHSPTRALHVYKHSPTPHTIRAQVTCWLPADTAHVHMTGRQGTSTQSAQHTILLNSTPGGSRHMLHQSLSLMSRRGHRCDRQASAHDSSAGSLGFYAVAGWHPLNP